MTAPPNPQEYFACWYRLDGEDRYLLWFGGGPPTWDDGLVLDDDGTVPAFRSVAEVAAFARARGVALVEEEPILHDLDAVAAWLAAPSVATVDCEVCLAAWNLFDDVGGRSGGAWTTSGEPPDACTTGFSGGRTRRR